MKKIIFLILLLAFTACSRNPNPEDTPRQTPTVVDMTEFPQETPQVKENNSETLEDDTTTEDEPFTIYESGVLGIKFSVPNPEGWIFHLGGRGNRDFLLIRHQEWHHVSGENDDFSVFDIGVFTEPPENWNWLFFGNDTIFGGWQYWQQPIEPDQVFVTDNGLTVVQYSHTTENWVSENEYTNVLFIFREDGRDYRKVEGRSTFYAAMLNTPTRTLGNYYDDAVRVINGIKFLGDAVIHYEPSEEAVALGLTQENFPIIDGATSTAPLFNQIIETLYPQEESEFRDYRPWRMSRTIPSYELLINGEVDLILVPEPSNFVLELEEQSGVTLEYHPIATEALAFITSTQNPVTDITREQVLQIYKDRSIYNWSQLGGNDGIIIPLNRNPHSGSQTLMDNLVLDTEEIHPDLEKYQIGGMTDMLWEAAAIGYWWDDEVHPYDFALGYTVYYFLQQQQRHFAETLKMLSFDGVMPTSETIASGEYPLTTNYYAVIRDDTPHDHSARIIINWLLSPSGKEAIERAGIGG